MDARPSYGTTRARSADVSYGQIEAAAEALLARGIRPTVEGVRDALQSGSQRTLLNGLQRFWKELGGRISGLPDSRRRLPAAVANLADSLWQTALTLATDAAEGADAALKEELAALRTETEVRGHALAQREIELDALIRSRERTIRELEEHLRSTMALVNKREATIQSLESRLATALSETDEYRQRLATAVAREAKAHRRPALAPRAIKKHIPASVRSNPPATFRKRVQKKTSPKRKKKGRSRR